MSSQKCILSSDLAKGSKIRCFISGCGQKCFSSPQHSTRTGSVQHPTQWVLDTLSVEIRRPTGVKLTSHRHFYQCVCVCVCVYTHTHTYTYIYIYVCISCMLLFNFENYVFLVFRSVYSASLCCSVYCLSVNVYCTAATGCQPNCS
jgi:hypothetical protein